MKKLCLLLVVGFVLVTSTFAFAQVANPDWWREAAAPYAGTVIRGVTESTPPSMAMRNVAAVEFEELTSIRVELETTSWDEMYSKSIADLQAGTGLYDFLYIEQDIIFAYMDQGWLTDLTPYLENEELLYPEFDFDNFTEFVDYFKGEDGNVFALPFEAFLKSYIYRTDLFGDPDIQAAFEAEYGYPLDVPKYWSEYEDIAEFFTNYGQENNLDLYGHVAQAAVHPALAYEVAGETIFPTWGIYWWGINMDNHRASVENGGELNSDLAKEGLEWYIHMLQYAPTGVRTYTWDEVAAAIGAGRVAQGLTYLENLGWLALDEDRSAVVGKLGVGLPPVLNEDVWAEIEAGDGYIGYYDGGAIGIPAEAENKDAAWLFAQFVTRKEWAPELVRLGTAVVRYSTFEDPVVQELDEKMGNYFTFMQEYGKYFYGAPPQPYHLPMVELYMEWISRAVAGEVTPSEALDNLAADFDQMMEDLGY